jgi:hypothetical protein
MDLRMTHIMRQFNSGPEVPFEEVQRGRILGALLVHYNLQMRPSGCNSEQVKLLKRRENQRVQTGQVGLANRRIQPLCHLSAACFQQLPTTPSWRHSQKRARQVLRRR